MTYQNRLFKLLNSRKAEEKYFMPFFVAGDPNLDSFKEIVKIVEPYADIIEIGIPFSDPIADGPTIQEGNVRAFKAGINTIKALEAIKELRVFTEKPFIILTYYNILIQGSETIEQSIDITFENLKNSGIDGMVIADLPIEEAELVLNACEKYDLALIFLVAPSTTEERLEKIIKKARGFIYLISVMGVTGARESVDQITKDNIARIKKKTNKDLPVFVGFGISKPEHVKIIIDAGADGIIIGSAIVDIIKNNLNNFPSMKDKLVDFHLKIRNSIKERM
ncbi:MAG: tryptophan synthase subunit alpha [Candidatus Lokiarchaeota archaeon]|nr:tryptophan synthase subunit alpha [Candidatus Lokiarchaeota archaeon]